MEYLKTYYSLEKHLEETVKFNPQFEILNSIWKLNKKSLSGALSNVNQYFPHYSLHDKSHSVTIVNNIELFLGEERIKKLSPTNTWLILMASFTHDLGMVVFQEVIENEWGSQSFQDFLVEISSWDDENLSRSGNILYNFQEKLKTGNPNEEFSPIEVKNAVTLAVAEYMRRIHHKRSSDILKGIDKTFGDVAKAFYSDQIPNRLLSLLGDIAYLHGVEFYEVLGRLEYESNGISNDKINPRFIASMLRLGDLLDIDDGRFNQFTLKSFNSPQSSINHQKKHSSIKHFLITPDAIEITADCIEEEVYRLARSWFDWLEKEVENLNKEWSNIAPNDLGGSAPRIPKGKIKVFSKGIIIDERFLNLKFQVSNQKIFEILEGGSIYDKAEFTFLRELVQNALDATKIQLWKEIERGTYDFAFKKHFRNDNLSHTDIISRIKFPNDIPNEIFESYRVKLDIFWKENSMENLIISVSDEGTGISSSDLIRMTTKVGESRKGDKNYKKFQDTMPFWLKPTGAFGVGLQSLFILVDSFEVITKTDGEIGKEITFRSSKKDKYSSVKDLINLDQRGTKVLVCIPKKRFPEVFGTSFSLNIVSGYDHFRDNYGDIYIHKIESYIRKVLFKVDILDVDILGYKLSKPVNEDLKISLNDDPIETKELFANFYSDDNSVYFQFFENIIGSEFILQFFYNDRADREESLRYNQTDYLVRNIPVDSNNIHYSKLSYSKLLWDFMSPASDKILSITREKFISKYMDKVEDQFLNEVLKKALEILLQFIASKNLDILKNKFENQLYKLSNIYFKIVLTLKANEIKFTDLSKDLLQNSLNCDLASYNDSREINYSDFFNVEKLIVPVSLSSNGLPSLKNKKELLSYIGKDFGDELIIWADSFFTLYIRMNYLISAIEYYQQGYLIHMIKTSDKNSNEPVKIDVGAEFYYNGFLKSSSISERPWNYSIDKFAEKLSVWNRHGSGFERFQYLSNTSIISPFANKKEFENFYTSLNFSLRDYTLSEIREKINDQNIYKYVTQTLVNWILENSPFKENISKESIFEAYGDLIAEIINAKMIIERPQKLN